MISSMITIAILLAIVELYSGVETNAPTSPLSAILMEARNRYVEAYRLDPSSTDRASIFDEVIRRSTFVNGTIKIGDSYTFKQILVDAYSKSQYGSISKSEALFVYDFVMEGYREVMMNMQSLRCDINLNQMKEYV